MNPTLTGPKTTMAAALVTLLFAFISIPGDVHAQTANDRTSSQPSGAQTSEGEVSNVVQSLSQEIMSPYCPGKTLSMCPSGGAAKLRRRIQDKAETGMAKAEIKDEIIDEIGEKYRREEPPTSDNIPLAALVVLGLLACTGAVWYLSRGSDDEGTDDGPPSPDLDKDDEAYVDALRDEYME